MIFYDISFHNACLNSFNISCLFFNRIIISSAFIEFSSGKGLGLTVLFMILFPINSLVVSATLWATFLEAIFGASSHAIIFFPYFLDRFLVNDKNHYPWTHFLVMGSIQ